LGIAYDQSLDLATSIRVWRVRMWEMGHSFAEIDKMNLRDFGDVIGYWNEKNRGENKLAEQRKNLSRRT